VRAQVAADSRFVPHLVRTRVEDLTREVKSLRAFQDSWRIHREGKDDRARLDVQRDWPKIEEATAVLMRAKPAALECERALRDFLRV
jgi:hypothetical protein